MKPVVILFIVIKLALGGLFIYAGTQKFVPKPPRPQSESAEVDPNVAKIRGYIGGLKQTGYFWPMLGVAEIAAGVLLVSQMLALLGAVILVPITLNIFMFHLFLTPDDIGEILTSGLYLAANLAIIGYYFKPLKSVFLNFKLT